MLKMFANYPEVEMKLTELIEFIKKQPFFTDHTSTLYLSKICPNSRETNTPYPSIVYSMGFNEIDDISQWRGFISSIYEYAESINLEVEIMRDLDYFENINTAVELAQRLDKECFSL